MTWRFQGVFGLKFGYGFSHHQTSLLCQSPPKTMSRSPSPSISYTAPPASTVRKLVSMTKRSQPAEVRRYQTTAGGTLRKLTTKSYVPSLSRSATRAPVCSVEVPGTGRSPVELERWFHCKSRAQHTKALRPIQAERVVRIATTH